MGNPRIFRVEKMFGLDVNIELKKRAKSVMTVLPVSALGALAEELLLHREMREVRRKLPFMNLTERRIAMLKLRWQTLV